MPVPTAEFKKAIKQLTDKEKEALLLKAVRRDAELYDIVAFELLDIPVEQLVEEASEKIHDLMYGLTGRSLSKSLTRSLRKSIKEIARFKKITKNVKGEADLHLYLLRLIFQNFTGQFDSFYKSFFTATARLVLKTAQLIKKNLDEDYFVEYEAELDEYLEAIHSRRKPLSFTLPQTFEEV
jgi:hypothetical protein